MSELLFKGNGITSLGSVDGEEDLKPIPGKININPPPSNGRCDGCGRHLSELKPFGKAGDPLVGDFDGALLVKSFRPDAPPNEEVDKIWEEFFGECHTQDDYNEAKEKLIQTYGEEKALQLEDYKSASETVGKAWLCRDCIILEDDEYFKKRRKNR
jgi:hypothetical protein